MPDPIPSEPAAVPPLPPAAFDYDLPPELIAQAPAERRDGARLLVLSRRDGGGPPSRHHRPAGAAVAGRSAGLQRHAGAAGPPLRPHRERRRGRAAAGARHRPDGEWECLGRPARRLRPGARDRAAGGRGGGGAGAAGAGPLCGGVRGPATSRTCWRGTASCRCRPTSAAPTVRCRSTPSATRRSSPARPGAVAAPTAGLHFSRRCSTRWRRAASRTAFVTLHVGPATFLPLREDDRAQTLDGEWAEIPAADRRRDRGATRAGGRPRRRRRHHHDARPRIAAARAGRAGGRELLGRRLHPPRLSLRRRRRAGHQLPPAALDAADAGRGLRRARAGARRLRRGGARAAIASTATATRC